VCIVNKNVCIVNKNVCIVLLLLWYFTSAETIRLTRDRQIEVGEEIDYVPITTLSLPE